MLGGAVLIQTSMSLTQKFSWADLSTLLCSHYLKGKLTELNVHLVCMKKEKMKNLEEKVLLLLT